MRKLQEPLILSVSGPDGPGILGELAGILDREGIELVDVEQATLQEFLAVSFLVDLGGEPRRAHALLSSFFPAAGRMGLSVEVRPISDDDLRTLRQSDLWAMTLLGGEATSRVTSAIGRVTGRHMANIMSIRRLAEADLRAAEFIVDTSRVADVDAFRRDLFQACEEVGADLGLAREAVYRQSKRIIVFDADSTLVAGEVIDELARRAGVEDEVRSLTRRAMDGEIDFGEALSRRVALLAGLTVEDLEDVACSVPLTPGAEETVAALQALGFKIGVISGGFTFFTDHLRERLNLDYAYGNRLEVVEGRLTGRLLPPVIDAEGKAARLREIASLERAPLTQVVGVGDGANDIPMLRAAGLGVAFRAKPATRRAADGVILGESLTSLLYLLGVSQRAVRELMQRREAPS